MTPTRAKSVYFYGPKSFLSLILIGFGFVTLPLISALVYAALFVDELANRSQTTVYQAVQSTQNSRLLIEQITAMERNARQYQVLGDEALFRSYSEKHRDFQNTVARLSNLTDDGNSRQQLAKLAEDERQLYEIIAAHPHQSGENEDAIGRFIPLTEMAQSVLSRRNELIDAQVDAMNQSTGQALRTLLWLAMTLVPVTLIAMIIFTVLLARPIKQIDQAIRRLGGGEFSSTIAVTGPRDLEYLGDRLDWLRTRLLSLEMQKTRFLRHISHELKTPLTALREGAELLADEVVGGLKDEQREVVQILRQNSLRLQHLIEDLLKFNLATSSHELHNPSPVRLDELIQRVIGDHKLTLVAKDVRMTLHTLPSTIQGEEEKLRVVIDNLLSNAVKYVPSGGTIDILLRPAQEKITLDVMDSGPGVRPEDTDKIFDVFYQGLPPSESQIKGSGLGLSIAREHVLAHHGKIEVMQSKRPGGHFRVTLPVTQPVLPSHAS